MAGQGTMHRLGWLGTGRMGEALARRLLAADCDVAVYNRTKAKAEPLAEYGAKIVNSAAELADRVGSLSVEYERFQRITRLARFTFYRVLSNPG